MDNELDEGMVEKARAAFEAMTKAMLDAGRRYEERTTALTADGRAGRTHHHRGEAMTCDHDHDDGLGMLTARDTPTPDRPVEPDPAMVEAAKVLDDLCTLDDEFGLDPADVRWVRERARAARAALTAAGVPGLVAQVERLRYDLDHSYSQREWSALTARATSAEQERDEFERRYATVLRNLNVAQQERDRLRAGIEALAGDPTAQDETGTWIDRKRVADLLAGSGEQPGECEHGDWDQGGYCNRLVLDDDGYGTVCGYRPAPVVHNHGTEDGPGLACPETRLPDGSLRGECIAPVVLDSPDVLRERVRRAVKRAATWTEDGPEYEEAPAPDMVEEITDAVLAAVRPTGQEQADG